MKNTSFKKFNTHRLLVLSLQIIFLLALGYQAFYLYGVYQDLQITPVAADNTKTTRSNLTAYKQAMQRFQDSVQYTVRPSDLKTPFKTPPKTTD